MSDKWPWLSVHCCKRNRKTRQRLSLARLGVCAGFPHALIALSGLPGSHRAAMLLGRHTSAFKYPQKTSHGVHLSEGARHALHPNLEINRSNWIKMFIVIRAVHRLWWLRPGENKRSQEARISTSPLYSPPHALSFSPLVHCTDIEIWRLFCRTQVTYCMGHPHLI